MKYLLLVLTIFLIGCTRQPPLTDKEIILKQASENLILKEKLLQFYEPENTNKPFVVREYTLVDGSVVKIVEPADCMFSFELEFRFRSLKHVIVCDNTYWLPTKKFIEEKMLPQYDIHKKKTYSTKFDCDDYSREFAVWSRDFYSKNVVNRQMEAIAICELYYNKKISLDKAFNNLFNLDLNIPLHAYEKHAINAVILDNHTLLFIEPQSGKIIELEKEEVESIYFMRF